MTTLSVAQAAAALTQAGWPAALVPIMVGVGKAESGLRVDATSKPNSNGTVDHGWLQINSVHSQYNVAQLLSDPVYTAKAGLDIYQSQGLKAWSTYNSGAYKVGGLPDVGALGSSSSSGPTVQPTGLVTNAFGDVAGKVGAAVQPFAYRTLVLAAGVGLAIAGLWRMTRPARRKASDTASSAYDQLQTSQAPQMAAAPSTSDAAAAAPSSSAATSSGAAAGGSSAAAGAALPAAAVVAI